MLGSITEDEFRDLLVENMITDDDIKQIISALKLQKLVVDMEEKTGRSLVDVQNWLSKEGKLSTQVTNKVLHDLLKESHYFSKVRRT